MTHPAPRDDPFGCRPLVVPEPSGGALERLRERLARAAGRWQLTARQTETLRWLLLGLSNKEIATRLCRSEVTVEAHVTGLLRRGQACSRGHLMARFWLDLPEA
jgi:DNA-binding CsgD family transcriptional regulator